MCFFFARIESSGRPRVAKLWTGGMFMFWGCYPPPPHTSEDDGSK